MNDAPRGKAMRRLASVASLAVSGLLLIGIFLAVKGSWQRNDVWGQIAAVSPARLLLATMCFFVGYVGAALRYRHLLHRSGIAQSASAAVQLTQATYLAAYMAPVGAVSDILRIGYSKAVLGAPLPLAIGLGVLDRMLGVVAIGFVGALTLPFQWAEGAPRSVVWTETAAWAAILVGALVAGLLAAATAGRQGASRWSAVARLWTAQLGHAGDWGLHAVFAVVAVGGFGAGVMTLADALGIAQPLMFLWLSPFVLFVQNLPFVYAGWGAREGAFVALGVQGVTAAGPAVLLGLSLLVGACLALAAVPGAILFAWTLSQKLRMSFGDLAVAATDKADR